MSRITTSKCVFRILRIVLHEQIETFCWLSFAENRYKHEAMVDNEPILFEILDTCPKVNEFNTTQIE